MNHELCVVFDVDDTLYLEHDYVVSGFRAVGQWAARWLSIANYGDHCIDLFENGQRGQIFDNALCACGREPAPELIAGLVSIYRTHKPQIAMMADAARAFEEILPKWPIGIVTDGPVVSQSLKCEAMELPSVARLVVLTGAMGEKFHKPQRGAFEQVAAKVEAKEYVYVADNPAKDFTAPHQLGWHTVRIRREGGLHYGKSNDLVIPDFELADCSELSEILARAIRARVGPVPISTTMPEFRGK